MPSLPARARRQACVFSESNAGAEPRDSRDQGRASSLGLGEPAPASRLQPQTSWLPPWDALGPMDWAQEDAASAGASLHGPQESLNEHSLLPLESMGSMGSNGSMGSMGSGRRQRRRGASVLVNEGSGPMSLEELDDTIGALPPPPALASQGSGVVILLLGAGDQASSSPWAQSTSSQGGSGRSLLVSQVSVLDIQEPED